MRSKMSTNLTILALLLALVPAIGHTADDAAAAAEPSPESEEFPMNEQSLAIIQQFDQDYDQWQTTNTAKKAKRGDKVTVVIRKKSQSMSVTVNGEKRFSTMVGTGMPGHTTPNVSTQAKSLERVHMSRQYHAPLPYAIRIVGGYFIHAATEGALYYMRKKIPHSHGCVRVPAVYARQLYDIVSSAGIQNTKITVTN
jgi:lipoprotein-anchoring transpeptidase ErfK/SrfK